jgi:hypothetical protein
MIARFSGLFEIILKLPKMLQTKRISNYLLTLKSCRIIGETVYHNPSPRKERLTPLLVQLSLKSATTSVCDAGSCTQWCTVVHSGAKWW